MHPSETKHCLIEVIVCTEQDAEQAELGGANRLEVVRDLVLGGLSREPG